MSTDVEPGLARLAQRLHGAQATVVSATRLTGGANLETWTFDIRVPTDGTNQELHGYILRRRTGDSGALSIDLNVEAALIQSVARRGVLAPPLVHLCDAADGLGEAHITRRIPGETLGRKIVSHPQFESARPQLARQCGEQLALIHATSPPTFEGGPLQTQDADAVLLHYERVYRESGAQRPVLELAFQHLRSLAPPLPQAVLLHGDFRNGNLIVNPTDGLAAVLDWELSHLGDPAEDLGWLCVNSWRFGMPHKPVGGFGEYEDLLAGYLAAGGEDIELDRVRYWQAVGSLKWAIMCFMMAASASGTVSLERSVIGRRVSETEIDLLNLFEAGV